MTQNTWPYQGRQQHAEWATARRPMPTSPRRGPMPRLRTASKTGPAMRDIVPNLPGKDDPGYDAAVRDALEKHQNELRQKLSTKKVTMRETEGVTV